MDKHRSSRALDPHLEHPHSNSSSSSLRLEAVLVVLDSNLNSNLNSSPSSSPSRTSLHRVSLEVWHRVQALRIWSIAAQMSRNTPQPSKRSSLQGQPVLLWPSAQCRPTKTGVSRFGLLDPRNCVSRTTSRVTKQALFQPQLASARLLSPKIQDSRRLEPHSHQHNRLSERSNQCLANNRNKLPSLVVKNQRSVRQWPQLPHSVPLQLHSELNQHNQVRFHLGLQHQGRSGSRHNLLHYSEPLLQLRLDNKPVLHSVSKVLS